jgi:hypothetical protein
MEAQKIAKSINGIFGLGSLLKACALFCCMAGARDLSATDLEFKKTNADVDFSFTIQGLIRSFNAKGFSLDSNGQSISFAVSAEGKFFALVARRWLVELEGNSNGIQSIKVLHDFETAPNKKRVLIADSLEPTLFAVADDPSAGPEVEAFDITSGKVTSKKRIPKARRSGISHFKAAGGKLFKDRRAVLDFKEKKSASGTLGLKNPRFDRAQKRGRPVDFYLSGETGKVLCGPFQVKEIPQPQFSFAGLLTSDQSMLFVGEAAQGFDEDFWVVADSNGCNLRAFKEAHPRVGPLTECFRPKVGILFIQGDYLGANGEPGVSVKGWRVQ